MSLSVNECIDLNLVHSIHNTQRMSHRSCGRKYDFIFRQGYYPTKTPKPLEFGVAYHVAMQTFYEPRTWHDKVTAAALALKAFKDTCEEQYKKYCRDNEPTPEVRADYDERIVLGLGMLKHYFKWESPEWDSNLEPVKVEISFEVPIDGPNGEQLRCKCDRCFAKWIASEHSAYSLLLCKNTHQDAYDGSGREFSQDEYRDTCWDGLPVTFGGRIDAIVKDRLGRLWIVDWKTAARLSTGEPGADDDFLYLDDQITGYCWALRKAGIPIAGFIYAEIKKALPEEPEPMKVIRLGRRFSVSQQINTTYEMYYKTVKENDPGAFQNGAYDDFLEFLKGPKGPKYHLRHQIERNDAELDNAGLDLFHEAQDILRERTHVYRTPGRFTCGYCAYREPCVSKNRGEDYVYTLETLFEKRTKHYFETEAPSTDKAE